MDTLTIEYETSVFTQAGWRGVTVTARAMKVSAGMAVVKAVELIDGETPAARMSRTGARRQAFNGVKISLREIGAKKRLSACRLS